MPTAERRLRDAVARGLTSASTLGEQIAAADSILRSALGADIAAWGTVDPVTSLSTSCAVFGPIDPSDEAMLDERERERRIFELEWEDHDPNTFGALLRDGRSAAGLRRDVGDPGEVRRYRELLRPLGAYDELRLVCTVDGFVWATVIFYRTRGEAFDQRDVERAAAVSVPLARTFRHAMLVAACEVGAVDDPPGALLVAADGSVLASSAAAESLLSTVHERDVWATITNLALGADMTTPRTARVAGSGGVVALHASPAKGVDGAVSIVVERPRRPELAPLIMTAFGFTPREREVVELTLTGLGRGAVAHRLAVAVDTVGDHLTSAYRKAGVGGRAELSALLYNEYYEGPRSRHVTPSPYGYFLSIR